MRRHLAQHRETKCGQCASGRIFASPVKLNEHLKHAHAIISTKYNCLICCQTLDKDNLHQIEEHLAKHSRLGTLTWPFSLLSNSVPFLSPPNIFSPKRYSNLFKPYISFAPSVNLFTPERWCNVKSYARGRTHAQPIALFDQPWCQKVRRGS